MRVENQPLAAAVRRSSTTRRLRSATLPGLHATIGSMADLEAASVEDVREFHGTYLRARRTRRCAPSSATSTRRRRRRLIHAVPSGGCRRRTAAGAARHPAGAGADEGDAASRWRSPWPLPAVVVAYHITYDGQPRLVSAAHRGEVCCRTARPSRSLPRSWCRGKQAGGRQRSAAPTSSRIRTCFMRWRSSSRGRARRRSPTS